MTRIYEMRETRKGDINGYVYAAISTLDTAALRRWQRELQKAQTFAEAAIIPPPFISFWFGIDSGKPDWPYSGFSRHACSRQMWEVIQPFCADKVGWIQLPPDQDGVSVEWGLLFGIPEVDLSEPLFDLPHLFTNKSPDSVIHWPFCSEELRAGLIAANCVGIDFVAREI